MKVLMDTDCLIKLTKSKLKELVCRNFSVIIPQVVKEEVIDNAEEHPDAMIIKGNIETGLLGINKTQSSAQKGEDAVFTIFQQGKFDAVCSDDKRFIKRLRLFDIPYITPSVFIAILLKKGKLTIKEAHKKLDSLSPFVSEDEYNAIKLVLDNWRIQ
ncbi:MAG: hypothetical protein NT055_00950 [Nitrospirae bacterium]|nr:hypothetical protein [Nitrospirota bacterium]